MSSEVKVDPVLKGLRSLKRVRQIVNSHNEWLVDIVGMQMHIKDLFEAESILFTNDVDSEMAKDIVSEADGFRSMVCPVYFKDELGSMSIYQSLGALYLVIRVHDIVKFRLRWNH